MTDLLQQVIAELEKLPSDAQDAMATRILADLEDDRAWDERFNSTTAEQWARLTEMAQREIDAGDITPLEDVFPMGTSEE